MHDGEPLWLDEDRAQALALARVEADTCGGCGHSRAETMLPTSEGQYDVSVLRCHACAAKTRKGRDFVSEDDAATDGLLLAVHRRRDAE